MTIISDFFNKLGMDMLRYSLQHLYLSALAIAVATAIAVPLGIYLTRTRHRRLADVILGTAGAVQTIPALALIAFIVLFFTLIKAGAARIGLPEAAVSGLHAIGFVPGLVALVLYALLPILRNTYTGIRQVDPAVIEVATGMGMKPHQILFQIELPLSLPVIMAGIRISTVWTIGIATLCGFIGAGGLGELIFRGLRSLPRTADYLVAGTAPAACLALLADAALGRLENWFTPAGIDTQTDAV